jgi:hypothetical protein
MAARVSSNAFASNYSQNSGNCMTDIPTTRVMMPPGGASSLSLAWEDHKDGYPRVQARALSNAFQPRRDDISKEDGNLSARTPTNRIAKPPGGISTLSLAWTDDVTHENQRRRDYAREVDSQSNTLDGLSVSGTRTPRGAPHHCDDSTPRIHVHGMHEDSLGFSDDRAGESLITRKGGADTTRRRVSSNAFASSSSQNNGNCMTDIPTTRVMMPPRGASSFSLAWEHRSDLGFPKVQSRASNAFETPRGGISQDQMSLVPSTPTNRMAKPAAGASTLSLACTDDMTHTMQRRQDHARDIDSQSNTASGISVSASRSLRGVPHACKHGDDNTPRMAVERGHEDWLGSSSDRAGASPTKRKGGTDIGGKIEVEGSRPRVYRPSTRANLAHRGHSSSFRPDWTVEEDLVPSTRKQFPEAGGAGSNRDSHSIETLRFFQPSQSCIGKQRLGEPSHFVEEEARNMFRYYYPDHSVGKARVAADTIKDARPPHVHCVCDPSSTRADSSPDDFAEAYRHKPNSASQSQACWDADDLPLGAEWTYFHEGTRFEVK